MIYEVVIPKKIVKFIDSLENSSKVYDKLKLLKNFNSGMKLSLDIKTMKGNWRGFYRLRIGEVRFIFEVIDEKQVVFIERADFRGKVYS